MDSGVDADMKLLPNRCVPEESHPLFDSHACSNAVGWIRVVYHFDFGTGSDSLQPMERCLKDWT